MVAVLVAVVPGAFTTADAADQVLWSVLPTTGSGEVTARPYFQPILVPGVQVQDSVTVNNKSDAPIDFDLRAVDAFNTREGSYALRRATDPKVDLGAWIHLSTDHVTVPAQTAVVVPFTIDPPTDATPGDHPGGIVAVNTNPAVDELDGVGARIYGRVQGPVSPHLDVTELQISTEAGVGSHVGGGVDAEVSYRVTNTGNIRLEPVAHLSVSPLLGGERRLEARRLPELLPKGSAVVHEKVDDIRPAGRLVASLTVTSGASGAADANAEATAWAVPWVLILLVLLIVGGVVGVIRWRRRRAVSGAGATTAVGP